MDPELNCSCWNSTLLGNEKECINNSLCDTSGGVIFFNERRIILLHFVSICIFVVGLIGNLLTCYVIITRHSMRRSIHFYTFNLAVSDLLILLVLVPTQMITIKDQLQWHMGSCTCKLLNIIGPIGLHTTIGTLLAITIDRARGLMQPFKWRSDSRRLAKITIFITWVICILFATPSFMYSNTQIVSDDGGKTFVPVCLDSFPNQDIALKYWFSVFFLLFVIPLLIIILTHVVMFVVILRDKNSIHAQHHKHMIRMVVALVIVFTLCTGSQHVYFFINTYFYHPLTLQDLALGYSISNLFVSLQAALNPIIYGSLRRDFNKAFRQLLIKTLVKLKLQKRLERGSRRSQIASKILRSYITSDLFKEIENKNRNRKCDSPLLTPTEGTGEYNPLNYNDLFKYTLTKSLVSNFQMESGCNIELIGLKPDSLPDICSGLPLICPESIKSDSPTLERGRRPSRRPSGRPSSALFRHIRQRQSQFLEILQTSEETNI